MNQPVSKSMHKSALPSPSLEQLHAVKPSPILSFQLSSDSLELKQELAISQHQLKIIQQQLETLKQTNTGLRQKVIKLTKKCNRAQHFSHHDELTGLPNRRLLLDRLKQAMVQSVRQHKQVALLFVDLDRFKDINDRLGHFAGDQLLQQVARRLTACIRTGDTVCRYGGDEFVVMLTGIDAEESATVLTEKIRVRLSPSFVLDAHIIEMTASIGVAVYQPEGQNCNDFIKQADTAMYLAKLAKLPTQQLISKGHTD